jgi:hypothetical protein
LALADVRQRSERPQKRDGGKLQLRWKKRSGCATTISNQGSGKSSAGKLFKSFGLEK